MNKDAMSANAERPTPRPMARDLDDDDVDALGSGPNSDCTEL